jgi:hypothetical protein
MAHFATFRHPDGALIIPNRHKCLIGFHPADTRTGARSRSPRVFAGHSYCAGWQCQRYDRHRRSTRPTRRTRTDRTDQTVRQPVPGHRDVRLRARSCRRRACRPSARWCADRMDWPVRAGVGKPDPLDPADAAYIRLRSDAELGGKVCRHGVYAGQVVRPWCGTPGCAKCRHPALWRDRLSVAQYLAIPECNR